MELFKISDNYSLNKESFINYDSSYYDEGYWNGDYICIVESNNEYTLFAIDMEFADLSSSIEENNNFYEILPTHFYNITNGEDFLMHHFYFVKYCIENLNFSENNFKEDLAKYIIKILRNMVFI